MSSLISSLIPLALVIGLTIQNCRAADPYKEINDYLIEHEQSEDIEPNLAIATQWIDEINSLSPLFKSDLMQVLEHFVALGHIDSKSCTNPKVYYTLMRNYIGLGAKNERRVNKIFNKIASKRATDCRSVYPLELRKLREQMDESQLDQVEAFLSTLVRRYQLRGGRVCGAGDRKAYVEFASKVNSLGDREVAEASRETLLSLRPDLTSLLGPDSWKKTIDGQQVERLVKEHLVEPCEYYTFQLKATLEPARFDAIFVSPDDQRQVELAASLANYRLCRLLVEQHKSKLTEGLVSLLGERPE